MKENKMKSLLKKIDIKNTSTYLVVIIGYFVLNYMSTGGMLTRQMKGLLVPLCLYIVLECGCVFSCIYHKILSIQ